VSIYYTLNRQTLLAVFFKVISINSLIILMKNRDKLIVTGKKKASIRLLAQYRYQTESN
jgi:hypothetical protein